MERTKYIAPRSEVVRLNVSSCVAEGDFNVVVSGKTRPEDSEAKEDAFIEHDGGSGAWNLWED